MSIRGESRRRNASHKSRLDSPLLINGALLRHGAPFVFIGCSAATELFGSTFTELSEEAVGPPANLTSVRSGSECYLKGEKKSEAAVWERYTALRS
ncbi:hypothetical protein NQZ68_008616, partial [Dissostichus eleginoides]